MKDQPEVCAADAHAVMTIFITMMQGAASEAQTGATPQAMDEADPQIIAI